MERTIRAGAVVAALALLAPPAQGLSITAQMQGTITQANDAFFFDLDPALELGDSVTLTLEVDLDPTDQDGSSTSGLFSGTGTTTLEFHGETVVMGELAELSVVDGSDGVSGTDWLTLTVSIGETISIPLNSTQGPEWVTPFDTALHVAWPDGTDVLPDDSIPTDLELLGLGGYGHVTFGFEWIDPYDTPVDATYRADLDSFTLVPEPGTGALLALGLALLGRRGRRSPGPARGSACCRPGTAGGGSD